MLASVPHFCRPASVVRPTSGDGPTPPNTHGDCVLLSMKIDGSLPIRVLMDWIRGVGVSMMTGLFTPWLTSLHFLVCRSYTQSFTSTASVQSWSRRTSSSCRSSIDTAKEEVQRQDFGDHLMSPCNVVLNLSCVLNAAAHNFSIDKKLSPLPQSWLKRTEDRRPVNTLQNDLLFY